MSDTEYNPNRLLDTILAKMQLKNDAALACLLQVPPPLLSKIRHHRLPVGASLMMRMHEVTGVSVRDLRDLMGDRRVKYRLSDTAWSDAERNERLAAAHAAHDQKGGGNA